MVISVSEHPFAEPANGGVGRVAGSKAIVLAPWGFTEAEREKRRQARGSGTAGGGLEVTAGRRGPQPRLANTAQAARAREDAVDLAGRGGPWSQADDAPGLAEERPLPGVAGRGRSLHSAPEPGARGRRHVPPDRHPR